MTWSEIGPLLVGSAAFRAQWHAAWTVDFDYMWKPVPLHPRDWGTRPFFAVLWRCHLRPADASAFADKLRPVSDSPRVLAFPNLGGRSLMICPRELGDFPHLAAFCRNADASLADELWAVVGEEVCRRIDAGTPAWCNTHGAAVPWLHLRFDPTLKYASFPPYGSIDRDTQAQWYDTIYAPAFGDGG